MLNMLMGLNSSLQRNYVNGKPLFLADPSRSIFKILSDSEYRTYPIWKIQEILRTKHIVVMGRPMQDYKFDERGLRTLRPLNEPITIHGRLGIHALILSLIPCFQKIADQSINHETTGISGGQLKEGTLRQILDAAMQTDGKVLNALAFPLVGTGYQPNSFSSDHAAWMQTLSAPFSKDIVAVPVGDIRWGSCATAGAFNNKLSKRDGLGMVIDPVDGLQLWFSTPEPSNIFHQVNSFIHSDLELDKHEEGASNVEAIVLEPGTRL